MTVKELEQVTALKNKIEIINRSRQEVLNAIGKFKTELYEIKLMPAYDTALDADNAALIAEHDKDLEVWKVEKT